jgi:anti-sigma regulatory factor (Ser/Thr protein kinase)
VTGGKPFEATASAGAGVDGKGELVGSAPRESQSEVRPLHVAFPATPGCLRFVRTTLEGMGLPEELLQDATLLTNELVTNSIRHAGLGPDDLVDVTAEWSGASLRVIVRDGGPGTLPSGVVAGSIRPSPGGESGWGLYLVDKLASRWGTNLGGTAGFWFELEASRRSRGA